MRYWVAITDYDWYRFLAARPELDEANFWQPSAGRQPFRAVPGDQFLFKLHADRGGWIVGGGTVSVGFTIVPPRLAWDAFGPKNGAPDRDVMLQRIGRYAHRTVDLDEDEMGGYVLIDLYFLPQDRWVAAPTDWATNIVQGKTYDSEVGEGARVWVDVQVGRAIVATADPTARYGSPTLVRPRLGQGGFKVAVTQAYSRRCAISGERTMPVLEAAHIRPYADYGPHDLDNGLLLRSDLHTLFDGGYITIGTDLRVRVSRRIREEWENGRDYYALEGRELRSPVAPAPPPSALYLEWHNDVRFKS